MPQTNAEVIDLPPENITISINAQGDVAWNGNVLSLSDLETRFNDASKAERQPTIVLKADKESRYDVVAQVMSRASGAGLSDIAFATDH